MATHASRITRKLLAASLAMAACAGAAPETAGKLLVDLNAADFAFGAKRWPQHTADTGIPGDFMPKGSPTRQTVAGAEAVVFDGDGDYFVGPFTTAALHAPRATHSVEVWVFQGNVRDQESVVSWGKRWGRPDLSLAAFRYGTDPDLGAIGRWGSSESPFESVPSAGQWHLITYIFDGSHQSVYVDGKLDNTKPVGLLDAHDMLPIQLGAELCGDLRIEGPFTQYSGALGKVRIHSGALTADQVKRNFESERTAFPGLRPKPLRQPPVHRFSFNAPPAPAPDGTKVPDLIGGLSATVRGANAAFTGQAVQLPGGSSATEAYLDFPNGLISSWENVTIEFWETQSGPQVWSRILSIGTNKVGEIHGPGGDFTGSETLTLFGNVGAMQINRFARSYGTLANGGPDRDPASYPDSEYGVEFHQVITYDKRLEEWHWYRNGLLMEVIPDREGPSTIDDVNVWIGRSEFSADNNFRGLVNEVRIYNHALDESEIQGNFLAGPEKMELAGNTLALNWKPVAPGKHNYINTPQTDVWSTGQGGPHPDGPGNTATFAGGIQGDQEISLDSPVTLGALNFGSASATGTYTLRAGKNGAIVMDSGGTGPASITQPQGSPPNELIAPLTIVSDTEFSNQSSEPLKLGGSIHGRGNFVKTGTGPLVLAGDGGSYNGQLRVLSGELVLGGNAAVRLPMVSLTTITAPGSLVFDRPDDVEIDGEFTGSGGIFQRGKGALTLSESGFFTHAGMFVQQDGSGTFTSAGLIDGPLEVRSDADIILRGRSLTRPGKSMAIGTRNGGFLTLNDSARVEVRGMGHLIIGDLGTGQSVLAMKGGSIQCREIFLGKNNGTSGVVLQKNGDITKQGQLDTRIGGGVPGNHGSWGAWRITGGTLQDSWNLQIGAYGTGLMEVDGGDVKVVGFLSIGRYADDRDHPSHGMLDVKSGTVTSTQTNNYVLVGEEGVGVLNIRGGTFTCVNKLMIGAGAIDKPGDGTVNLLTGGTLVTCGITQMNESEATGRLWWNGGTLKAGASSSSFIEGLDRANVGKAGARIDTNGFDLTINQDLLAPAGSGIASIPVLAGGENHLAAPFIAITGGGGDGACALAEVDGGSIRAITITHPGNGYTSAPEVTAIGGGSGTGLKLGTPVLGPNAGGGLVKTGAGTLTLGGSNTYPGVTRIEQGTLAITGRLAGSADVSTGACLGGGGIIEGSLETASGSSIAIPADGALKIHGNAAVHGALVIEATPSGSTEGGLQVGGRLDLTGSTLVVKSGKTPVSGKTRIIASYGSLLGTFPPDVELPEGYALDYNFKGLKQIALVAKSSNAE